MVGQLYKLTDIRRDGAYTIFYMGINVGAAIGTILVGYLGQTIGWGYGFGLAGIGMLAGLVVFVLGKKALRGAGEAPAPLRHVQGIHALWRRRGGGRGDLGAGPVSGRHPEPADRLGRRAARLRRCTRASSSTRSRASGCSRSCS